MPDVFEGAQWQACQILATGIAKAGSIEADKLRPVLATIALASIKDASELLGRLFDCCHSAIAGRLAAAFRRVGLAAVADDLVNTMP